MQFNLVDLSRRLQDLENLAAQNNGAGAAKQYAGAVMSEVTNPLESINNVLFLMALCDQPEKLRLYVEMAQTEVSKLNEIAQRTLVFCYR